jgi:hypothetical protein
MRSEFKHIPLWLVGHRQMRLDPLRDHPRNTRLRPITNA